jgi:hypothetical protein
MVPLMIDQTQSEYGVCHFDPKRITFASVCADDPALFWSTLRHELQHMALMIGGPAWAMTDGENESIIRCMDELFFPAWDAVSLRRVKMECRGKPPTARSRADDQSPESTN